MRVTIAFTLLCVATVSCGGGANDGPSQSAGQLSRCVAGWWQDPAPSACACPGAPECDASDCESTRVIAFTPEGVSYTGVVRVSAESRSASPTASLSRGKYFVEEGRIRIVPEDAPPYSMEVSCQPGEMVANRVVKVRAQEWLAADLRGAVNQERR